MFVFVVYIIILLIETGRRVYDYIAAVIINIISMITIITISCITIATITIVTITIVMITSTVNTIIIISIIIITRVIVIIISHTIQINQSW